MYYRNVIYGIYKMVSNEGVVFFVCGLVLNIVCVFFNFFWGILINCFIIFIVDLSYFYECFLVCFL